MTTPIDPTVDYNKYIDFVDSTTSFPESGTLQTTVAGVIYDIPYTSKSSTQFFGLVAPVALENSANITTPDYAYAVDNDENDIRVKITGVLGDLIYDAEASNYYSPGDNISADPFTGLPYGAIGSLIYDRSSLTYSIDLEFSEEKRFYRIRSSKSLEKTL